MLAHPRFSKDNLHLLHLNHPGCWSNRPGLPGLHPHISKKSHLLNTCCVLDTVLRALHLIILSSRTLRYGHDYTHFPDEKAEAQRVNWCGPSARAAGGRGDARPCSWPQAPTRSHYPWSVGAQESGFLVSCQGICVDTKVK